LGGEWRDVFLEDVADEVTVGHVGPMVTEYVQTGIPFLRSQNVEPLRISETDIKFISAQFDARLSKSSLRPGDVVIVRTGRPGACAVIPPTLPIANCADLVIVRCGADLDPRYLAYYITGAGQHHVDSNLVGAVQQHFNVGSAKRLLMRLPPLGEQRRIVDILGPLDDKIELNRRTNETLEAIARALFKSWFVDFDPVCAKSEGRDPGLPPHLADLFPDSFANSELGAIPRGWRVLPIGELAVVVGGSTPSTKEATFWEDGRNYWATPKDLSSLATPVLLETERMITDTGLAQIGSGLLPPGTVLLSSRAPIGYLAVAEVPLAINQGFIAMRPAPGVSNLFLLYWAGWASEEIVSRANGSTFLEISKSSFRPIPVVAPTQQIFESFDQVARPAYSRILANERESRILISLRDTLLPKLISGEMKTHAGYLPSD
jgi:type I restriction enzyme S subunit